MFFAIFMGIWGECTSIVENTSLIAPSRGQQELSDRLLHSSLYSRHNTSPAYFLIGSCVKEGGSEIIYLNLAAV